MLERLSEKDAFGRFYLKSVPSKGLYSNYYASLDAIKPLIKSKDWSSLATGYYINATLPPDAARVSFFTSRPKEIINLAEKFLSENNIEHARHPEFPHPAVISEQYGGEEIRFRRFLYVSTLITLDLMEKDLLYARCLFAAFRFKFMKTRKPYEEYFLKTFEEKSQAYLSLSDTDKKQFWLDLKHWPNPSQVDWIHLPVNMALACDINRFGKWQEFVSSNYTLSQEDILYMLKAQGLNIPEERG